MSSENDVLENLNNFFTSKQFPFEKKILFCPGTAPMRGSEISDILHSTDFDVAYFVDPEYSEQKNLQFDLDEIAGLSRSAVQQSSDGEVRFQYQGKERVIRFVAADATKFIPDDFNVYFSGKRVCIDDKRTEHEIKSTPSDIVDKIVAKLPVGGLFFPDRDCEDDSMFFKESPESYGLEEVKGIRTGKIIVEHDGDKAKELYERYYKEAVIAGKIRAGVPEKVYFTHFDRTTLKDEKYNSLDDILRRHPGVKQCEETVYGYNVLLDNGNHLIFNKRTEKLYTEDEQKLIEEISNRSFQESEVQRKVRHVGLYRKVK